MKQVKLTGIILKKSRLKQEDQQITLFSRETGKVSFIAPGASKITSRRIGQLDSLNVISVVLSSHHGFWYVREVDLVSVLDGIKRNYAKRGALLTVLEVLEKLLPAEQEEAEVYAFLMRFLVALDKETVTKNFLEKYLGELSALLGYGSTPLPQFVHETTSRPLTALQL